MDTVSHAAWGYATLRWKGKKEAWAGAIAGAAPDLLFYIPFQIERAIRYGGFNMTVRSNKPEMWREGGPPLPPDFIDAYNHYYVFTHSFVIVAAVLGILWLLKKRWWLWLAIPYCLHILMDIPTHERYQTPFLFPISTFTIQGISWSHPLIFWPNWIALIALHIWLWKRYRRPRKAV
jgi:membrane-bound metal-dependent hydrolase YbcI (DUF457 family)